MDPYKPCPCGSGKKFKFCCRGKGSGVDRAPELNERAQDLMHAGRYEEAEALMRRAIEGWPKFAPARNNLALLYWVQGRFEEAIETLRAAEPGNVFAAALGAELTFLTGTAEEIQAAYERLEGMEPLDPCALGKKIEALSWRRMHDAVLRAVEGARCPRHNDMYYFAGVAAANLGELERARAYLRRVERDSPLFDRARRTLDRLDKGPGTLHGEFDYFQPMDYLPAAVLERLIKMTTAGAKEVITDLALWQINLGEDEGVRILAEIDSPRAIELLKRLAFGTFGEDKLRMTALIELNAKGIVKTGEKVRFFQNGEWTTLAMQGQIEVTPEVTKFVEGEARELLANAIEAQEKGDLDRAEALLNKALEAQPDLDSAYQNLAVLEARRGRYAEAEKLARKALEINPQYVFGVATLIELLLQQEKTKEAQQVLKEFKMPASVHPKAYAAFEVACARLAVSQKDIRLAKKHFESAKTVDPKNPAVKDLGKFLKRWEPLMSGLERMEEYQRKREKRMRERPVSAAPTMREALERYSNDRLFQIARASEVGMGSNLRRADALEILSKALADADRIRAVVGRLESKDREGLERVIKAGGVEDYETFTRACDALERLEGLALVVVGRLEGRVSVVVPVEVRRVLSQADPRPEFFEALVAGKVTAESDLDAFRFAGAKDRTKAEGLIATARNRKRGRPYQVVFGQRQLSSDEDAGLLMTEGRLEAAWENFAGAAALWLAASEANPAMIDRMLAVDEDEVEERCEEYDIEEAWHYINAMSKEWEEDASVWGTLLAFWFHPEVRRALELPVHPKSREASGDVLLAVTAWMTRARQGTGALRRFFDLAGRAKRAQVRMLRALDRKGGTLDLLPQEKLEGMAEGIAIIEQTVALVAAGYEEAELGGLVERMGRMADTVEMIAGEIARAAIR